jgi:hypothetical protein
MSLDLSISPETLPAAEKKIYRLSPSQLSVFLRCEKVWARTYIDELKKKRPIEPAFFAKGTYFHQLLHFYYQGLQSGLRLGSDTAERYMLNRIKTDLKDLNTDNVQIMGPVVKMVNRYVQRVSPRIDKDIHKILGVEFPVQYMLETPVGSILLEGFIDLVYADKHGIITVRDHKSGQKNTWGQAQVETEPQLLFYNTAVREMGFENVRFAEINFANSHDYVNKEPAIQELFKLFRVEFSDKMLDNYRDYLVRKATRILQLRNGEAEAEYSFTKDCGKCDFHDLCKAELRGQPTNGLIRTAYVKVDRNKFREENKTPDSPLDETSEGFDFGVR